MFLRCGLTIWSGKENQLRSVTIGSKFGDYQVKYLPTKKFQWHSLYLVGSFNVSGTAVAGEVAQQVKCLLRKDKDLSLIPVPT